MTTSNSEPVDHRHGRRRCRMWKIPLIIAAVVLGKSAAVFFLWNALMPELFHLSVITFPQAIGLLILAKILFGGFRGGHGRFGPPWRRWSNLSDEQRAKLREEIHRRC